MLIEIFHPGRGNTNDLVLRADGKIPSLAGVSRIILNVAGGSTANAAEIAFPLVGAGGWGSLVSMAIVDGGTLNAGNVLMYDNDQIVDQTPNAGDTVTFAGGALDVSLS